MIWNYGVKFHRRYVSSAPLSYEEREEMCFEMVGFTTWDNLTAEEKKEAVEREVWKSEEYDKWREDQETKFLKSKRYKRLVRKYGDEE